METESLGQQLNRINNSLYKPSSFIGMVVRLNRVSGASTGYIVKYPTVTHVNLKFMDHSVLTNAWFRLHDSFRLCI